MAFSAMLSPAMKQLADAGAFLTIQTLSKCQPHTQSRHQESANSLIPEERYGFFLPAALFTVPFPGKTPSISLGRVLKMTFRG